MLCVQAPNRTQPTSTEIVPSTGDPVPKKPRTMPTKSIGDNPAFRGLTARRKPTPDPGLTKVHAERGANVGAMSRSAIAILGKVHASVLGPVAGSSMAIASETPEGSLDNLPTELIRTMNLNPEQMQFVSHRYAEIYHGEAASLSLASNPARARSLPAVSEAVAQLERVVPDHLRHDPLAVLCARLEIIPPQELLKSFDVLVEAINKCVSTFEPLTELFSQTDNLNMPVREACQAKLMSVEGADAARVAAYARAVLCREDIPLFLQRIDGVADSHKSVALGALANQLFTLPLGPHEFARICEDFHEQPWPPAAASGLLGQIGWISEQAQRNLIALSRPRA